jgi:hypothetical protein
MTPVRIDDTLENPPLAQFVRSENVSLNCVEHDVPDALHCVVIDCGPPAEMPDSARSERLKVLEPALVVLSAFVMFATTVLIAFWMEADGGVTRAGGGGAVGVAALLPLHADNRTEAQTTATK